MILIGIGANLPSRFGPPEMGLPHALDMLNQQGVHIIKCSPWYGAHAVPRSEQPDFVNAVAEITTGLPPVELLQCLQAVERDFGRVRGVPNAARALDLDLLAYNAICHVTGVQIPHPRMHLRAFVLAPLCDIAPEWCHPVLNLSAQELFDDLPPPHGVWRLNPG
jgi:2-amino-4-hydroxy-6-hydroxymethyldihydropteridine diphosphokinase